MIATYFNDRRPHHLHLRSERHRAKVRIADADIIDGELPARVLPLVAEWAYTHRSELAGNRTSLATQGTFADQGDSAHRATSSSAIDTLAVRDLEDGDLTTCFIDQIDDSEVTLANARAIRVARKFLATSRPWIDPQLANTRDDPVAIRLRTDRRKFLPAEVLNSSLYSATPFQVLQHSLEGNAALTDPHVERFEIFRVFGYRQSHRLIDDV